MHVKSYFHINAEAKVCGKLMNVKCIAKFGSLVTDHYAFCNFGEFTKRKLLAICLCLL